MVAEGRMGEVVSVSPSPGLDVAGYGILASNPSSGAKLACDRAQSLACFDTVVVWCRMFHKMTGSAPLYAS